MKKKSVKFEAKVGVLKHLPGMRYLEIPRKIIDALGGTFKLRLICTVNKKLSFQCGLMALGGGRGYISITLKRLKALGVREGATVQVELTPDESKFGMAVPDELEEVLKQDAEARNRFEKLTPGRQRYIIQYVSAVKNPDLRIERAMMLLENLKLLPVGKEFFRKMLGKWD